MRVREALQGLLRQAQVETLNSTFVDREARFGNTILAGGPGSPAPTCAGLQVAVIQIGSHRRKAQIDRIDECIPMQPLVYASSGVASTACIHARDGNSFGTTALTPVGQFIS